MKFLGLEISRAKRPAPDKPSERSGRVGAGQVRMIMDAARTGRLETSWDATPDSIDSAIAKGLRASVARCRGAVLNDDYAKAFARVVRTNVVGFNGIGLRSTPRDLGGKIDNAAKDAIEDAWKRQSKLGHWEVTGTMSRQMFERLWIGGCAMDGEAIAMIVSGDDAGPTGFGLQIIDPMRLDPMHNEVLSDGRYIRHGIECNRFGRPLAYHLLKDSSNLPIYSSLAYGSGYDRIPAERVIHAYIPEIAGQKRGIPWMSAALWRMNMMKGFEDAAAVNARIGAAKMGFFRDTQGDMPEDEDLPMNADPGTFENIGSMELVKFDPQFPDQAIEPFIRAQLRGTAVGLGISYASLSGDLSQSSFSSMREGRLSEQDEWKTIQGWMIDTLERRVFEAWIDRQVLAAEIRIKGNPLRIANVEKYKDAEFKPRRWAWVDPAAEVAAAKMAVEAGLASRTRYIEEWGTQDAYEVFEEIGQEQKDMKTLGVKVVETPGAGKSEGGNPDATKKPAGK